MIKINLTENQYLKLWHGQSIRIKRDGTVYYIEETSFGISITDWMGNEYRDIELKYHNETLS